MPPVQLYGGGGAEVATTGFPAKGMSALVGSSHPAHAPKHWKQVVGAMWILSTCRCPGGFNFHSLRASVSAQAQASHRVGRQIEPLPKAV